MATCFGCTNLQRVRARARSVSLCVTCAFFSNYADRFSSLIPIMFRLLTQTYYQANHQSVLSVRVS